MGPSISVRKYIRWFPDTESEPTDTVVVTSVENRFVDIRILKPTKPENESHQHILPFSRLDWAFVGTSSTEIRKGPNGEQLVHSKWKHWIDSHHGDAEGVNDEGDMIPQRDGLTLERGAMVNPATGKMTQYEECWKDVEPVPIKDKDKKGKCVVLQLHDDQNKARGMVVRVGQRCQGFMRIGDRMTLERWVWHMGTRGWQRLVRMGDLFLPCAIVLEDERLKLGGEIKFGDYSWKVAELSEI